MTLPRILLIGAGGHAAACIDVIEATGGYSIAGLVGQPSEVGQSVLGHNVIGTDTDLAKLRERADAALVVVGQIKSPDTRIKIFQELERLKFALPVIVSPHGYVSPHASVGAGTIVMHGAVVNARARVGRNCIINSLALVEHDAVVGDHCHIATGARLNSAVRVGDASFIGSGATVRQSISIGARSVIGMGQNVVADGADGAWLPPRKDADRR